MVGRLWPRVPKSLTKLMCIIYLYLFQHRKKVPFYVISHFFLTLGSSKRKREEKKKEIKEMTREAFVLNTFSRMYLPWHFGQEATKTVPKWLWSMLFSPLRSCPSQNVCGGDSLKNAHTRGRRHSHGRQAPGGQRRPMALLWNRPSKPFISPSSYSPTHSLGVL